MSSSPTQSSFPADGSAPLRWTAYALFVLFIANLGAIADRLLHPEIPYLDPEHLLVGAINAAALASLFVVLEIYLARRRKTEWDLHERERQFQTLFENTLAGVAIAAGNDVLLANRAILEMFGYSAEEFYWVPLAESIAPESREAFEEHGARIERGEPAPHYCEYTIRRRDGSNRTVHAMSAKIVWQGRICRQVVLVDITERKWTEAALIEANSQLTTAGNKIKILSGLLPICCGCKRIKDDNKYWHEVDRFITEHSEATFTHGYCPECAQKYYPELDHKKYSA